MTLKIYEKGVGLLMSFDNENENINEELAALYDGSIADIKEGEVIKGTIVQITDKEVLVDIGYKAEGVIYKSEISYAEELKVGDKIDVFLESKENDHGMVVLSHEKARKLKGWQNILDNHKEGDILRGKVSRKVRGGFMVDVGLEAFLPASLSAMQDSGGGDSLLGKSMEFKIVKINIPRKNIVLSRKEIVDEARVEEKKGILENLNKGDVVRGIVRNITDFGAFIDIGGGITGLLHITDMSWGRINHPSEVVSIGNEVDVNILDFDKETMKVSLGLKQNTENPWENIDEKFAEGAVVKGKVVNIMPYGVFVELERGIEGLIHISEFSWSKKFNHPNEKFKVGDIVEAMVLKVDKNSKKLSLGMKQLEGNPWEGVEEKYKVSDKIKGTVSALTDYGAFIELEEGIEGLVHVSDLSWTKRVNHPKEALNKGDKIEAVILNVDEQNRRIALGVKQLVDDPWEEISKRYESGTKCEGTITNITNFGVFVELEKDLEGLLHVSEIELAPNQRMEDLYKIGDNIKVKVIHIDGVQKKIALSQKDVEGVEAPKEAPEAEEAKEEVKPEEPAQEEVKPDLPQEKEKPEESAPTEESKEETPQEEEKTEEEKPAE